MITPIDSAVTSGHEGPCPYRVFTGGCVFLILADIHSLFVIGHMAAESRPFLEDLLPFLTVQNYSGYFKRVVNGRREDVFLLSIKIQSQTQAGKVLTDGLIDVQTDAAAATCRDFYYAENKMDVSGKRTIYQLSPVRQLRHNKVPGVPVVSKEERGPLHKCGTFAGKFRFQCFQLNCTEFDVISFI